MKKWSSFLYTGLLLSMCGLLSACSDDEAEKKGDENGGGVVDPPIESTILGENTPTPIESAKYLKVDGGSKGVSIEVTEVKNETFVFNLQPGVHIQSYKLDVFPLPMLYNYLFELKKYNPGKTSEDMIHDAMFATDGSGSYGFGINELGENWDFFELNWAESKYKQFEIAPEMTYVIAAIGCFDDQATEPAEMTLCYVTTTHEDLIGDPKLYIEAGAGYQTAYAKFEPNPDTYYYYTFCNPSAEIDEYIDNYGHNMFLDLIRSWFQSPNDAKDEDTIHNQGWSFTDPDPTMMFTVSGIALDMNKTKGQFTREEIHLKEIPSDAVPADQYHMSNFKASARKVEFETTADVTCSVIFYDCMTLENWESIKDNASALATLRQRLIDGGWAIDNRPAFDNDLPSRVIKSINYLLVPDTEYVIVSVARNRFLQHTEDVAVSESFSTKPIVIDNPSASMAKVSVKLSDPTRTTFKASYQYNEETALYYHQMVLDKTKIDDYLSGANPERLIHWLAMYGTDQTNSNNWVAVWTPDEDDNVSDRFNWAGLDPAQTYYYAIIGEDWNGVFSEVYIDSITTQSVQAGPNPEMLIQSLITDQDEWFVNFAIVKDVSHHRFMILDDIYSTDPDYSYEDCLEIWEARLIGEEGFDNINSGSVSAKIKKGQRYVALCTPYGENEVKGEMIFQMFDPTLNEDYKKCIVLQENVKEVFFNNRTKSASKIAQSSSVASFESSAASLKTPSPIVQKERLSAKDFSSDKPATILESKGDMIYFGIKEKAKYPKIITKK